MIMIGVQRRNLRLKIHIIWQTIMIMIGIGRGIDYETGKTNDI